MEDFGDGRIFAIGWFLSVAWLMLTVQITCRFPLHAQRTQSLMVAVWIIIGVAAFVWF